MTVISSAGYFLGEAELPASEMFPAGPLSIPSERRGISVAKKTSP